MEENKTPITQDSSSASINNEHKSGKGKLFAVLVVVLVLIGGAFYAQYHTLQNTKKELQSAKNELNEANSTILSLEEKAKVLRDKKRKKDLDLFTYAFSDYKTRDGSYPTTEGGESQNIYNNDLSKLVNDFTEPTTDKLYGFEAIAQVHTPSPLELGVIQYQLLGKCNTTNQDFVDTSSEDDVAIRTVLESGETYCLDI